MCQVLITWHGSIRKVTGLNALITGGATPAKRSQYRSDREPNRAPTAMHHETQVSRCNGIMA